MRARAALALAAGAALLLLLAPAARAAAPSISESWVEDVTATSAELKAKINPNGTFTTYRFEYVTEVAFQKSGYATALKAPPSGATPLGSGTITLEVSQSLNAPVNPLTPATAYRYRAVASSAKEGTTTAPEHVFATQDVALTFKLPDSRGWEMVSPVDKGGGAIAAPESLFGGGELQAAPTQGKITYGSGTAFADPKGSPPASQYLSTRTASGWLIENLSPSLASGAYGNEPDGAPYRLFAQDLSQGLLFGGLPCRGGIAGCSAPNPVIPGSGAPAGHMAYYLRNGGSGAYSSLLSAADLSHTAVSAEAFEVSLAAASPDLSSVVLSSCAKLSANATEVLAGPGKCDPEEPNLYRRSSGLSLVNLKPGDSTGTTGAEIAAPIGAVSSDGNRVYFTLEGNLYLREGAQSVQVDEAKGGGGEFQAASADGSVAFFSKTGHLYRFLGATKATSDLTPSGGLVGVLGISPSGADVYYQGASGVQRWHEGTTTQVAPGAEVAVPSDYPPATATARVTADGAHLAFLSAKELTGYDNAGQTEAYVYGPPVGGGAPQLLCASCNPTGERAQGSASIPGTPANGSTRFYRPRALSEGGNRLFFQTTAKLFAQDTNGASDVYQWEARGVGDCTRSPGCVNLLSSGKFPGGASFIDASADGTDAYLLTEESLISPDPGSIDLYDARAGGGFAIPPKPIPCIADACQALPPTPEDPDPGTLVKNSGNPPQKIFAEKAKKKKHKRKKQQHKKKQNGKGKYHVPVGRGGS